MREKIINNATDLFLKLGFKSVTMDDIANNLGISKKTIYQHFKNKTKLIDEATSAKFKDIAFRIDCICEQRKNPIDELFELKKISLEHLKHEHTSALFQLKKYYPKIYKSLEELQFNLIQRYILSNLKRGIEQGLYRKNLDVNFISRIYFNSILSIKDQDLFPLNQFNSISLMHNFLEYHLRGICTPKGNEYLNKISNKKTEII